MESRLEVLLMVSVREVLREEIVGLVKTRDATLEPSDKGLEIPSPLGDTVTSFISWRRIASLGSSSGSSFCSVNGPSVVGLVSGDARIPLPLLLSG